MFLIPYLGRVIVVLWLVYLLALLFHPLVVYDWIWR